MPEPLVVGAIAQRYRAIVDEIVDAFAGDDDRKPGLRGLCGHAIVAAAAARPDLAAAKLDRAVQRAGETTSPALWSGLSGLRWTVASLAADVIADDVCDVIDRALLHGLETSAWTGRHDLISGLAGIGTSIVSEPLFGRADAVATSVLDQLERSSIVEADTVVWRERSFDERRRIGAGHGLLGVIAMCNRFIDADLERRRSSELLARAIRWLQSIERPDTQRRYPAELPASPDENVARPGWCHSDAGAVFPLLASRRQLGDPQLAGDALAIGQRLVSFSVEELPFDDTGFCHGVAGFAHILHLLYRATGSATAAAAARAALARIVAMRRPGEGLAGFPAWRPNKGGWAKVDSIFEGDLGVALVLLAAIGEPAVAWEHLFALEPYPAVIPPELGEAAL